MPEEKVNFDTLLIEYRTIWHHRLLETSEKNSEETLIHAVKRELLDENSHPRIRKTRFEKYYSAISRVVNSTVEPEAKLRIIELHNQVMKELSKE